MPTNLILSQEDIHVAARYIAIATQITGEPLPESMESHHGYVCSETEPIFLTNKVIKSLPDGVCMELFPMVDVAPVVCDNVNGDETCVSRYVIKNCELAVFFESENEDEYKLDEDTKLAIQKATEDLVVCLTLLRWKSK